MFLDQVLSQNNELLQIWQLKLVWVKSLLKELHCPIVKTPIIWSNNIGAEALASNPIYRSRTKHVEIDIHFICEKVVAKEINVCYVPLYEQTTDCLTKALSTTRFLFLKDKLGLVSPPTSSLKGGS